MFTVLPQGDLAEATAFGFPWMEENPKVIAFVMFTVFINIQVKCMSEGKYALLQGRSSPRQQLGRSPGCMANSNDLPQFVSQPAPFSTKLHFISLICTFPAPLPSAEERKGDALFPPAQKGGSFTDHLRNVRERSTIKEASTSQSLKLLA